MSMPDRYRATWLLPAMAGLVAAPAGAATYFTLEQAQQKMLPGRALQAVPVTLTKAQIARIKADSGENVRQPALRVWRTAEGEWFYLDQVLGKHEFITYAVTLDRNGAVTDIEILDYRESYGDAVRRPQWRGQFLGKRHGAPLRVDQDIVNLSGATLSSVHLAGGVRRVLATHAVVMATAVAGAAATP